MTVVIKVDKLSKEFGSLKAVNDISFDVREGEIFGLLGPNGAGKTTTIKMLTTILAPTSGNAIVAGHDVRKDQAGVRQDIGIVFQDPSLDDRLTGRENLDFHAMLYRIPKHERQKRIAQILKLVELEDKANMQVQYYSGGMRRRLEIGRGLLHDPKVLFLDEPTIGLDTQTRRHMWNYIEQLNETHHTTIILTTHYIEEADYLCSRVAFVDNGKIVAMDTPRALKDRMAGDIVSLEIKGNASRAKTVFKRLSWVRSASMHDAFVDLTIKNGEKRIPELVVLAERHGIVLRSVGLHKPSLEDVFIHYTGKAIRDEEGTTTDRMRAHPMMWRGR